MKKFKVWDKAHEYIIEPNCIALTNDGNLITFHDIDGCRYENPYHYIIMWITPFTDVDNIPIYENDILEFEVEDGWDEVNEDTKWQKIVVEVKYDEKGELKAYYLDGTKWDNGQIYDGWNDLFYMEDYSLKSIKKIGNRYETPNLLEAVNLQ